MTLLLLAAGLSGCTQEPGPTQRDIVAEAKCSEPLRRATTWQAVQDTAEMRDVSRFIDASPRDEIQWAKAYAWPLCMVRAGFTCEGGVGPGLPAPPERSNGADVFVERIDRPSATCHRDGGSFRNPFGVGLRLR